jgi:hypothetical protein
MREHFMADLLAAAFITIAFVAFGCVVVALSKI